MAVPHIRPKEVKIKAFPATALAAILFPVPYIGIDLLLAS